jgi:membrane protease YdiL (CAAX protease family)
VKNKKSRNWTRQETIALTWIVGAFLLAVAFSLWQSLSLPIFTLLFLTLPCIYLIRHKDADRIGMGAVNISRLLKWAGINLGALALVYAIFEPWSGAYAFLLEEATQPGSTDPTFAWLTLLKGPGRWVGMFLFSGVITIFAEELCFRGWLLRALQSKVGSGWANALQAALFTLPQLIVAFLMPSPIQGLVFSLVYAFGAVGLINGWVARQAGTIWPNLIAAAVMNLILSYLILG